MFEISYSARKNSRLGAVAQYDIDPNINITAKDKDYRLPLPISSGGCHSNIKHRPDYSNVDMNRIDLTIARNRLMNWCEMYHPQPGTVAVSIQGNATWYVCNRHYFGLMSQWTQRCSRQEIKLASDTLDDSCGPVRAGRVKLRRWEKDYGRGLVPDNICPALVVRVFHPPLQTVRCWGIS